MVFLLHRENEILKDSFSTGSQKWGRLARAQLGRGICPQGQAEAAKS